MSIDPTRGIAGLKGALRYVRAYRDQIFVVKLGGDVLNDAEVLDQVAAQIALLSSLSIRLVVVHGGGPQATALSRRLGQEPTIVAGRRVTDDAALEVAKMVYAGALSTDLVAALREHRVQAVGLSGVDADLITAHRRPPVSLVDDAGATREVDFGHVGDVDRVDPRVITTLAESRFVPVVASLAGDDEGNIYNVNADTVAESLAVALRAQKLIFLTGAPGVLRDRNDPSTLVTFADPDARGVAHDVEPPPVDGLFDEAAHGLLAAADRRRGDKLPQELDLSRPGQRQGRSPSPFGRRSWCRSPTR